MITFLVERKHPLNVRKFFLQVTLQNINTEWKHSSFFKIKFQERNVRLFS